MRAKHIFLNLIFTAALLSGAASSASAQKGLGAVSKLAAEESKTLRTFENASAKTFTLVNGLGKASKITSELGAAGLVKSHKAAGFERAAKIETAVVNAPLNHASKIAPEAYKDRQAVQATFKVYEADSGGNIIPDAYGTASLMIYKNKRIIITNKHVADDAQEFILEDYKGGTVKAFAYAHPSRIPDIGFIQITDIAQKNNFLGGIEPLQVAENMPQSGEILRYFGYDENSGGAAAKKSGGFHVETEGEIALHAKGMPGNSGSALLNERNEVVGVIAHALGEENEAAVSLSALKKALDVYTDGFYTYRFKWEYYLRLSGKAKNFIKKNVIEFDGYEAKNGFLHHYLADDDFYTESIDEYLNFMDPNKTFYVVLKNPLPYKHVKFVHRDIDFDY